MKNSALSLGLGLAGLLSGVSATGLTVDLEDPASIKAAAKLVAANLMTYYNGNDYGNTPGILPGPPPHGDYYWWQAGAMWGTYIDYWHFTGDTQYNDLTRESMVFQAGPPANCYMPENVTLSLGNDDQGFWGLSAMLAAETTFEDPAADQPQWLALAQGVWSTQANPDRHDNTCNGGLRWQIPVANNGYNYKNSISNGIFFNMGARLARYTGNDTYAQIAIQTWDWVEGVGFMSPEYAIYDGAHVDDNCTDIAKAEFSYNAAIYMQGSAFMYNYTNGSDLWRGRIDGILNHTIDFFFPDGGPAVERSCELDTHVQCKTDMLSFKGYLHRWLASVTQLAPYTHDTIMPVLKRSAAGCVKSCLDNGICGFRWDAGSYDGNTGAGQQMNALGALSSLLVDQPGILAPVTNVTGGTSVGNPNAGTNPDELAAPMKRISQGDRAGAGILTALCLSCMLATMFWLGSDMSESGTAFKMPAMPAMPAIPKMPSLPSMPSLTTIKIPKGGKLGA